MSKKVQTFRRKMQKKVRRLARIKPRQAALKRWKYSGGPYPPSGIEVAGKRRADGSGWMSGLPEFPVI